MTNANEGEEGKGLEQMLEPSELDVMEGLLRHLTRVFNHDAGGAGAVGRSIVNLGHWLRLHPGEPAGELIAEWLDEHKHRSPRN